MTDIYDTEYAELRRWIKRARNNGWSWESIMSKKDKNDENSSFFENNIRENFWPEDSASVWAEVVNDVREVENSIEKRKRLVEKSTMLGPNQRNIAEVPEGEDSCWVLYRSKLEKKGFANLDGIQTECLNILRSLSSETEEDSPVKGLVVGNVQSGKTANMAGLISMAADYGWNFFIVLSGTIESLRKQTRDRLYRDLNDDRSKVVWHTIDRLDLKNPDTVPSKINLKKNSNSRYLTVCLKNATRLRNTLRWINTDLKKKKQMKILVIDDEADQASINTAAPDEERRGINRLIVNLVEGRDAAGIFTGPYGAMNYVAYTATPYANFLSEGSPESLYPRDFITLLTPPNTYFGPSEIYGSDDRPGLSMINTYEDVDRAIRALEENDEREIPDGLKDAICWFACCVAILRKRDYSGPCSMLIHTHLYTFTHQNVANAVYKYLVSERSEILKRCEKVYSEQTSKLTVDRFFEEYPDFGEKEKILDYPEFSEIREEIKNLIETEPGHIKLDNEERIYRSGFHICIDNSKGMTIDDDENSLPRLLYPDENSKNVPKVSAFIVVGGNTLSRGLTIEGLVSTYFARKVTQGDTLMQMGRWFGYRRGYELLPRIWMSEESKSSFRELVRVDNSLRDFIRENYDLMTPTDFPPKVRKFPATSYLRSITARSKMRAAAETDFDFEGTIVETTSFDKSTDILRNNKTCAENFLRKLGRPEKSEVADALVWRGVSGDDIFNDFFDPFEFNKRSVKFNMLESLKKWISEKSDYYNWNVILAGIASSEAGTWDIGGGISINKVERSAERDLEDTVSLNKTLASPIDRVADVRRSDFDSDEDFDKMLKNKSRWRDLRAACKLKDKPVLIIYCISKDSKPSEGKLKLNVEEDLIGLVVIMPGLKKTKLKAQYLQIPQAAVRRDE